MRWTIGRSSSQPADMSHRTGGGNAVNVSMLAIAVLALGIFWGPLSRFSADEGVQTFQPSVPAQQAKGGR